jgi:hypothetical protein
LNNEMNKSKKILFLCSLVVFTVSSVSAATPTALLKVGTFKDMSAISAKDNMTPDHIPSGAAVVVACYLSDGNKEETIPATLGNLYKLSSNPYYHVYQKANTIVYDTPIHQQSSPTYGQSRAQAIIDGKDLKAAFNKDKGIVKPALLASQKTRDVDNKPTNIAVTAQAVDNAFKELDTANTNSGIYDAAKLKTFCKK